MSNEQTYEKVTERIIEQLEQGTVAWRKPWTTRGGHRNFNSGKPYRGINAFITSISPFSSPYWNTYKGWRQAAGYERDDKSVGVLPRGTKMEHVLFSTVKEYKDESAPDGVKRVFIQRAYTIANFDQLLPEMQEKIRELHPKRFQVSENQNEPIENAQAVLDSYFETESVTLGHGGSRAYYVPANDHVQLPEMSDFDKSENYYCTAFHEAAHSTGHSSRLHRFNNDAVSNVFGSESYSQEELVAEMTAAMLCGVTGIDGTIESSAAYIDGWLQKLKNDRRLIVHAASLAQKAADRVQGISWDTKKKDEAKVEAVV